jgi:uncharacterized protein YggE
LGVRSEPAHTQKSDLTNFRINSKSISKGAFMRNKIVFVSIILVLALALSACGAASLPLVPSQPSQIQAPQASASEPQTVQNQSVSAQSPQSQPAVRTITVTGTADSILTPDIAYIYIGVHTENADAKTAISTNNADSQKVMDALKAAGIADKDLRTTNFSVYPNQQFGPNGESKGTTYMVDNTVYVTVRDLSKMGDILDAAAGAGANSISGITFDVADKNAALSEARKNAIANARQLAEETAQAAGVSLGPIQSINYSSSSQPVPMFAAKGGAALNAASNVPVNPGQLTLTVDVTIVYAIQ